MFFYQTSQFQYTWPMKLRPEAIGTCPAPVRLYAVLNYLKSSGCLFVVYRPLKPHSILFLFVFRDYCQC